MDLKEYWYTVKKRWWLILLLTVLVGGAVYASSSAEVPVFRATTTVEILPGSDPNRDLYSAVRLAEMVAGTYVVQIQSPLVLREAAERLISQFPGAQLGGVSVQQVPDTQLIIISAENPDPALAQAQADTVAEVFIERELTKQKERYQSSLIEIDLQIAEVEASLAETQRTILSLEELNYRDEAVNLELALSQIELASNGQRLSTLLRSSEDFRLAMVRYTDYVSVFSRANLPVAPVRPNVSRDTMLGLSVGLMIGVGLVFLLEFIDDTIKSPDDIKRAVPVGVLGVLPVVRGANGASPGLVVAKQPREPISEAFRNLRTSVQTFNLDRPSRSILVTSPVPSEGKSFTASNLAASLAQGGQSVILVDADLRRPKVHRMFGLAGGVGLTTALLQPGTSVGLIKQTDVEGLRLVTSGSQAPNPAELLGSQRMKQFISWLAEQADVVIIDSPPLLAFADAAVLSRLADSTVLVVEYGKTRRQATVRAVERLAEVGANLLGVVINQMARKADAHYYNYYGYSNYYRKDDRETEKDGRRGSRARRSSRRRWRKPASGKG